jgi:hypothetical protein
MSSTYSGNRVPSGVVADVLYEKRTNLATLLHVVDTFSGPEWSRSIHHRGARTSGICILHRLVVLAAYDAWLVGQVIVEIKFLLGTHKWPHIVPLYT